MLLERLCVFGSFDGHCGTGRVVGVVNEVDHGGIAVRCIWGVILIEIPRDGRYA